MADPSPDLVPEQELPLANHQSLAYVEHVNGDVAFVVEQLGDDQTGLVVQRSVNRKPGFRSRCLRILDPAHVGVTAADDGGRGTY